MILPLNPLGTVLVAAFSFVLLSGNVFAQSRDPLAGHGLARFGMSKDQVKRLYPDAAPDARPSSIPSDHSALNRRFDNDPDASVRYNFIQNKLSSILIGKSIAMATRAVCLEWFDMWRQRIAMSYGPPDFHQQDASGREQGRLEFVTWSFRNDGIITADVIHASGMCLLNVFYRIRMQNERF